MKKGYHSNQVNGCLMVQCRKNVPCKLIGQSVLLLAARLAWFRSVGNLRFIRCVIKCNERVILPVASSPYYPRHEPSEHLSHNKEGAAHNQNLPRFHTTRPSVSDEVGLPSLKSPIILIFWRNSLHMSFPRPNAFMLLRNVLKIDIKIEKIFSWKESTFILVTFSFI